MDDSLERTIFMDHGILVRKGWHEIFLTYEELKALDLEADDHRQELARRAPA